MNMIGARPIGYVTDLPDHVSLHEACCLLGLHARHVRAYQARVKDRTQGSPVQALGRVQGLEAAMDVLNIPYHPLSLSMPFIHRAA